MTDLNKLREEFEQLPHVADQIEFCGTVYDVEDNSYTARYGGVNEYISGAWYAYQKQQAKFDLYMNDFTIAANCVKSQQKTIDALKAQLDKQNRTDFEIIEQTLELVDLLASSTNVYQRDMESNVYPFESENPRVMEWWRTSCQIQELITNTDPENCDFDEYKEMVAAAQKPHTITINGIEVPAPFEPKNGGQFWYLSDDNPRNYDSARCSGAHKVGKWLGKWRTEDDVKEVCAALRTIFVGGKSEVV